MGIEAPIMSAKPSDNTNPDETKILMALTRSLGLAKDSKSPNNRIRTNITMIKLATPSSRSINDALSIP